MELKKLKDRVEELSYMLEEQKKRNAMLEHEIIELRKQREGDNLHFKDVFRFPLSMPELRGGNVIDKRGRYVFSIASDDADVCHTVIGYINGFVKRCKFASTFRYRNGVIIDENSKEIIRLCSSNYLYNTSRYSIEECKKVIDDLGMYIVSILNKPNVDNK